MQHVSAGLGDVRKKKVLYFKQAFFPFSEMHFKKCQEIKHFYFYFLTKHIDTTVNHLDSSCLCFPTNFTYIE